MLRKTKGHITAPIARPPRHRRSTSKSRGHLNKSREKLKRILTGKNKTKKSQHDSNNSTATHTYNDSNMNRRRSSQQL
jgi:hypothetical protein